MTKLYDLSIRHRAVLDAIDESGGELTPELEAALDASDDDLRSKVESVCAMARELESSAVAAEAEADRLRALAQSRRSSSESLRRYLLSCVVSSGETRIDTARFRVTVCRTSNLAVQFNRPFEECPADYVRTKVTKELDKSKALAAHRDGIELPPGFEVEKRTTTYLKIK